MWSVICMQLELVREMKSEEKAQFVMEVWRKDMLISLSDLPNTFALCSVLYSSIVDDVTSWCLYVHNGLHMSFFV